MTEIENSFTYHSPTGDQPERYQKLRDKAKELAYMMDELCPESIAKNTAILNLEQAVMWANKSIACK